VLAAIVAGVEIFFFYRAVATQDIATVGKDKLYNALLQGVSAEFLHIL
jgi:hypothetical protein